MKNADRVIILPSSFDNVPELVAIMDERFVVFCREKKSYDYLVGANTKAKIILDHDMALRITNNIFKQRPRPARKLKRMAAKLAKRTARLPKNVRLFRTDRESAGKYATDMDLSGTLSWFSRFESRDNIDFAAKTMLETLAKFDNVETDRLHVGIAAVLTGADVLLFDNSYGKVGGVYNRSLCDLPNVQFCETKDKDK
jgi:exopolysaccharide biosynthesis predicted pyruvyltransferase EpsI